MNAKASGWHSPSRKYVGFERDHFVPNQAILSPTRTFRAFGEAENDDWRDIHS